MSVGGFGGVEREVETELNMKTVLAREIAGKLSQATYRHSHRVARTALEFGHLIEKYLEHIPVGVVQIVALLHDTVEGGVVTLEEIERKFGFQIRVAVDALTRRKGEGELYLTHYIPRVSLNPLAKVVKMADLYDNL